MVKFFHNIPGRSRLSDSDILRASIMAELDAINLYEGFADVVKDADIRKVLLAVAREEKVHAGEFHATLLKEDSVYRDAVDEGSREVNKLLSSFKE